MWIKSCACKTGWIIGTRHTRTHPLAIQFMGMVTMATMYVHHNNILLQSGIRCDRTLSMCSWLLNISFFCFFSVAFRIYDIDNDGFISNGELFQVCVLQRALSFGQDRTMMSYGMRSILCWSGWRGFEILQFNSDSLVPWAPKARRWRGAKWCVW